MDSMIDVPDTMFLVITPCATCKGQFYVIALASHVTGEYTCPDCRGDLLPGTSGKPASREADPPLL